MTGCPQKALGFCRRSAGGELAKVGALAVATPCHSALCARWAMPIGMGRPAVVLASWACPREPLEPCATVRPR
jgi:hypothetical protein